MSACYTSFITGMMGLAGTNLPVDLDTDTIKMNLVNKATDYTFSAAHSYLSSVTTYSGVTAVTLSGISLTGGVFNCTSPVTFTSVAISAGKTVDAVVIYKDVGGVAANSPLVCFIDGFASITPNGSNITVTIDSGTNKIFKVG